MVSFTVEINTSRAIAAQILRHRSFSFQEFSQRYAHTTGLQNIEWRLQGKTNRQVGEELFEISSELQDVISNIQNKSIELYETLVKTGVAKECARMILPLNTSTTLYMTGTVRSWMHYLELRTKEDTQKEHRNIAEQIKKIFIKEFPATSCALNWI
jgi:thymidylate synthase (FAD)